MLGTGTATIGTIDYGETYPISLYTAEGAEQVLAVNVAGSSEVIVNRESQRARRKRKGKKAP